MAVWRGTDAGNAQLQDLACVTSINLVSRAGCAALLSDVGSEVQSCIRRITNDFGSWLMPKSGGGVVCFRFPAGGFAWLMGSCSGCNVVMFRSRDEKATNGF